MSQAPFVDAKDSSVASGKCFERGADGGIGQHFRTNALLGHFLLIEERRLALFIGKGDLPGLAGRVLQRRRQVARPIRSERPCRLQHQFGRRKANQADLIVKLHSKLMLAALLEQFDQRRKIGGKLGGRAAWRGRRCGRRGRCGCSLA